MALSLLAALGVTASVPAGATTRPPRASVATCTGTFASPGLLAGTYPHGAIVSGYCDVDGGPAVVTGNLTIEPGATLQANFANDDVDRTGSSSLSVSGNVKVETGATLGLGCEPVYFTCADDPTGTLSPEDHIGGNLMSSGALGVVLHAVSITKNVTQSGGGGGVNCATQSTGFFSTFPYEPVAYSDYEDNTILGNLRLTGLQSCWIGNLRNNVHGNLTVHANTFADPDANETMQNTVGGNIACSGNAPAAQYGDSGATPNKVAGKATGECAFTLKSGGTPVSVSA